MSNSWLKLRIQDLVANGEAELKTGPFGTQLHASDYVDAGTPVINVRNIGFGTIREEKLEYIDDETVQRLSSHLLKSNDIVFGRKGAVERHAYINSRYDGWFQGSDCLRLRITSPLVNPRFASYHFLTDQHKNWMINQCSHGATMASLNQRIVGDIPLLLPPIDIQQKIIAVLSAYDDLIENNTRRIAILEEMAQALYREWFVHFRFPGHEDVKMVEVEGYGRVPEGWEIVPVREMLNRYIGGGWGKPEKDEKHTESAYVLRGTDLPTARHADFSNVPFRFHKVSNLASRRLEAGDIVFEVSGGSKDQPVGRSLLISQELLGSFVTDVMCASFCKLMRPNPEILAPEILYLYLLQIYNSREIMRYQVQSTGISNFKFEVFLSEEAFPLPARAIQSAFLDLIQPMNDLIQNLGTRNSNLRQTRDLLLPRLISGELDIAKLDIQIPEAQ